MRGDGRQPSGTVALPRTQRSVSRLRPIGLATTPICFGVVRADLGEGDDEIVDVNLAIGQIHRQAWGSTAP